MRIRRTLILLSCLMVPGFGAEAAEGFPLTDAMGRLGDAEFRARVAAQSELSAWGKKNLEEGIEVFYSAYRTSDDPEIRVRCRELLKELVVLSQSGEGKGYIGIMMQEDRILEPGEGGPGGVVPRRVNPGGVVPPKVNPGGVNPSEKVPGRVAPGRVVPGRVVPDGEDPGGVGGLRSVVRITAVLQGTPAEKAKLKVGDLVTGIDELDLREGDATTRFGVYVQGKKPKESVTLHLLREGKAFDAEVELVKRPLIAERNFLLWGEDMRPPSPEEGEEKQFRGWLKKRLEEENPRK